MRRDQQRAHPSNSRQRNAGEVASQSDADPYQRRAEKIASAKQNKTTQHCQPNNEHKGRLKEELAVRHCEKTENQAEQNQRHAVAGIEAYPTSPHCCFCRNDRGNLAHADSQRGVTRRELWPPEGIDKVDHSERKDDAGAKHHQDPRGDEALPILWTHCSSNLPVARWDVANLRITADHHRPALFLRALPGRKSEIP